MFQSPLIQMASGRLWMAFSRTHRCHCGGASKNRFCAGAVSKGRKGCFGAHCQVYALDTGSCDSTNDTVAGSRNRKKLCGPRSSNTRSAHFVLCLNVILIMICLYMPCACVHKQFLGQRSVMSVGDLMYTSVNSIAHLMWPAQWQLAQPLELIGLVKSNCRLILFHIFCSLLLKNS